jgi:glyoxylase-like metal-dependent hydrolase (beta-lactamase superfamily II)
VVGDLIFKNGVGRTDLKGGNTTQLLCSIYNQIFTLPPETRLLSGHGTETTVADEKEYNPYLQ